MTEFDDLLFPKLFVAAIFLPIGFLVLNGQLDRSQAVPITLPITSSWSCRPHGVTTVCGYAEIPESSPLPRDFPYREKNVSCVLDTPKKLVIGHSTITVFYHEKGFFGLKWQEPRCLVSY